MSATISPDRAAVFAALGDRTRLRLVEILSDGQSRSIQELSSGASISRQAMTKHLHVLERARLVRSARRGREVCFRLEQTELEHARVFLAKVTQQWESALKRLVTHVEGH
jgi:DNA-binding transcriptional ArsR family regulator